MANFGFVIYATLSYHCDIFHCEKVLCTKMHEFRGSRLLPSNVVEINSKAVDVPNSVIYHD